VKEFYQGVVLDYNSDKTLYNTSKTLQNAFLHLFTCFGQSYLLTLLLIP
jgi:hypothetical protein